LSFPACINHIVRLIGVDHVGIGSDFDGIPIVPQGLEDVSKMPALTAALMHRGYSESDVRKIMGENFMRVIRQVVGH
jgi:membrane dipeptidase